MEESAEKLETKLDDADLDRQEMCNPRIDREDYNDLMNDGTMISGTTFSKKWLHCTLVELLRQVQEKDINLPENLQNKLCIVWDISIHGCVQLILVYNQGCQTRRLRSTG
ncbi:hypothetical protein A3Q56_04609 [Intoshia linei]|uniref:Uncharacterized protein n=1 Tax=Intoshia linei TaxID=1819745 RepID=A0A177B050_9BILA|nr:hypothetical protein A3Q56_04609 [Intoshia linei]